MAPSAAQITSLLESYINSQIGRINNGEAGGLIEVGDSIKLFSDDIDFQIAGQGFGLACHVQGIVALKAHLAAHSSPSLASVMDLSKPMHGEVIRVIGGGESPWAAGVLRSTGTTKNSESLYYLNNS